jgi:hypothetical protein
MLKVGAVGTTFAMAGALAIAASGTTGAYFSDTKTGGITGTVGSILVSTDGSFGTGANGLSFTFDNLMPGVAQSAVIKFKNTGTEAQDVYLTFPNVPALHALNNLGSFGEVHVVDGNNATWFESTNLSDNRPDASGTCGEFRPTVGLTVVPLPCWPLPDTQKVASNVAPGASGQVTFSFNYSAKLGDANIAKARPASTGGGVFNNYPSPGAVGTDVGPIGSGLPFNVVAVQVNKQP